jgi:hypothetical protein
MPAYEWNFGDVNPPVHAFATLFLANLEADLGKVDLPFLQESFAKLLLNFTWWVNRKDPSGRNVFEGGFLGLDNIGVFDRSAELPGGGRLEQADGTAWMAMFSQNMLELALMLLDHDETYQGFVLKFVEHFFWIAAAVDPLGENPDEMWDEEDGFFYDVLRLRDGTGARMKVRSLAAAAKARAGSRRSLPGERSATRSEGRTGARTLDHVPARRILGSGGRGQAEGDAGAALTLVTQRLPDGGQSRGRGGVGVVPAGDGHGAGHGAAGPGRGPERAEGKLVAHRGDRVGRVVTAEQFFGEGLPEPGGVGLAHGDPQAGRVTSGLAPRVEVAVPPVPGHRVGHGRTGRPGEQRPVALAVDREAQDDGPGRAGEDHPADRGGGGPVVDTDHGQPGPPRAGVHDGREPAGRDRVQDRVVVAGGPHDEPVHHGVGDPLHVAGGPGDRDQRETDALGRADVGHAGQHPGRLRVVEGIGQPLAEDHPQAARPAPP